MSQIIAPKEMINENIKHKVQNICEHCKKRFPNASKLERHKIAHNDSKPFQCNLCQKRFKLKSSLQRHRQHSHENVKKHKCTKCDTSFAQRINLYIHEERLHRRRTNFKCPQCDCFFKRLNTLNRHKKACHTQHTNCTEPLNHEDDPNSLAKLVVTQLKSLEQGMSSLQAQNTAADAVANDDDDANPQETTFIEQAKFGETILKVKLNPNRILETIRVQTVKRPRKPLAYVCEQCAKEFCKGYNLIRHLRTHTKDQPYNCTVCNSSFTTKTKLETHFQRMHVLDEKTGFLTHQHKCFICLLNFSSMRKLDSHIKTHVESHCVKYFCSVCNKNFSTKTAFSTHRHKAEDVELGALEKLLPEPLVIKVAEKAHNSKQVDKVFTCTVCNFQLLTQRELFKHKKQHEANKKYKCNICGSSYLSNISLRTHQKQHHSKTQLPCTLCSNRTFSTKFQLERHKRHVHQEERNFQCPYCPQRFKTAAHCKSHMKRHLKELLGTPQQRNTLEQTTTSNAQLVIQEKNSLSSTPKFIQIEMLPKHPKFKHRNIKVYIAAAKSTPDPSNTKNKCSHCGKQFQKPSDLTRHVRLHTQQRPFTCDVCKKSFKLKSTLEDHHKTHLSNVERSKMSVYCQVCAKPYANQKSLRVHLRLHTGNFPFKCANCGKSFRTSGHHLAHLKAAKSKNGNCRNF